MNKINKIIKKETERYENIGCEVTNVEVKEYEIIFHINNYNNDCYGGYEEVKTVKFQEERKSQTPKTPIQSGELCPHCGNRIEKKHKFCPQCGQKIPKEEEKPQNKIGLCPHCGNLVEEKYTFCPHCGQKITSGGE